MLWTDRCLILKSPSRQGVSESYLWLAITNPESRMLTHRQIIHTRLKVAVNWFISVALYAEVR